MRSLCFFIFLLMVCPIMGQKISGQELLDRSIAFHDPNKQWHQFDGQFTVIMKTPNSTDRISSIILNNPEQNFTLTVEKDSDTYSYVLKKNECQISLNDNTNISEADRTKFKLNCERGNMMKNYYSYLYGLPMKLKDPGAIVDPTVYKKTFKNKEYLVLRVGYDLEVGEDIWYFYFDPMSYAMEVYQFFHDETKNDGEYILLSGLEIIEGIKMPKTRAWYYNKDNTYLGTDILTIN